ncbi:TonB family protein [uncultured Campylobacter sp.]|uniref:energy transducer TonB n=1 Tax=uncultured Campylobacter sp. TaxID=218934 RepID=UPI003211B08B
MKIPRLAWVFAFILASALHAALFVFIANGGKAINLEQNFGGFDYPIKNDQIESIMIISDLSIGDFKEVAVNSQKSSVPQLEEEAVVKEKEEEKPEIASLEEIKSQIEVVKKQEMPKKIKPKIKPKKIVKKPVKIAEETNKKSNEDTQKVSNLDSDINSVAKDDVASAPVSGSGTRIVGSFAGSGADKKSWQGMVVSHLNKHKKYPSNALLSGFEGVVYVRVKIAANGEVLSVLLTKGSKFEILNNEATELFNRASPLPSPPSEMMGSDHDLTLNFPIEFNIKKYKASKK